MRLTGESLSTVVCQTPIVGLYSYLPLSPGSLEDAKYEAGTDVRTVKCVHIEIAIDLRGHTPIKRRKDVLFTSDEARLGESEMDRFPSESSSAAVTAAV